MGYLWFRSFAVKAQYQSAVLISGLVTFIAAYHYIRIFNSWVDAYAYARGSDAPTLTGVPFNDAYRYMDWLLTVPLLLIEILLVMNLSEEEYSSKAWTLGVGSALMIVSGSYAERNRPSHRWQDPDRPGHDCHQLVHLSHRILVPIFSHRGGNGSGLHPDWLLHL